MIGKKSVKAVSDAASGAAWKPFKKWTWADALPAHVTEKLRKSLFFIEQAGADIEKQQSGQSPEPWQKYREHAPDSQPETANVPESDASWDKFNTQYYTRDVRRRENHVQIGIHPSLKDQVQLPVEMPKDLPKGSPGNKNPAVLRYDPSGTRSAMSTTWEAMNEALDTHKSTHMIRNEWEKDADKILASYESKDLPPVPGRSWKAQVPASVYEKRW